MKISRGIILALAGLTWTSLEASAQDKGKEAKKSIGTLMIYNGDVRTDAYFAPGLSAAEREPLTALMRAGNELAERERMVATLEDALQATLAAATNVSYAAPAWSYGYEYYNSGYTVPYPSYLPGQLPWFPRGYGYNTGPWGYMPPSPAMYAAPAAASAASISPSELLKALGVAQEQVGKAREAYATARGRVVFDNDGQVVGVRKQ